MNWIWFNLAALIVGLSLVLNGVPPVPVLLGVAGAAIFKRCTR